jgi:exopolyphosphatase/pppGpp-phosphohydrolase
MRADVFPAGLLVLDSLLEFFGQDSFIISANGLRFGAALQILEA